MITTNSPLEVTPDGTEAVAKSGPPIVGTTHPGILVDVGAHTARGGRPRNEDYAACYLGTGPERLATGVIAALADGMGGAKGGRVAAELAVRGFIDGALGQSATLGIPRIGARAADAINRWVYALG